MIRVRFAPSPTGPLHIGGVRTALYNYLLARKHGGTFILRIEDTDQTRFVPGAEQYIIDAFEWCGIRFDEGVHIGGPHAPYRQSDRKAIYLNYARELVNKGRAYYAFDTPDELEAMRQRLQDQGDSNQQYNASTRLDMRNSLSLPQPEWEALLNAGHPWVIRFKMLENQNVVVDDIIRGKVEVNTSTLDDKVLLKADGMPTYHLANIVDDHLMEISHVIRGEEWLPSAPLHALLYDAFGWQSPQFAHLPLLLKPEGSGKLSKRDGDRLGFPVFPLEWTDPFSGDKSMGYREEGYIPQAFINMLAFLGWNPGTEQELFTMEELVQAFSLERVGKSGSRFDPAKARWFNHQYLAASSAEDLLPDFLQILEEQGADTNPKKALRVIAMVKERVAFARELWQESWFFYQKPRSYDEKAMQKRWKPETPELLNDWISLTEGIGLWSRDSIHDATLQFMEARQLGMGNIMNVLRLCLVGGAMGPDLFSIMELIGRDETILRVKALL
jgi:glutamyl-tRNA synthetase